MGSNTVYKATVICKFYKFLAACIKLDDSLIVQVVNSSPENITLITAFSDMGDVLEVDLYFSGGPKAIYQNIAMVEFCMDMKYIGESGREYKDEYSGKEKDQT